jgi:hypothetical protein
MILIAIRLRRSPAGQEFLELVGLGHELDCSLLGLRLALRSKNSA